MAQALRVSNLDMLNCFEVEGTPHGPGQIDGRTSEGDADGAKMVGEGIRGVGVKTAAKTIILFPLY
jgi:hypothetical protein